MRRRGPKPVRPRPGTSPQGFEASATRRPPLRRASLRAALADEQPFRRERPSNGYLTGFLIPSGTPPERQADADEDDDMGSEVPEPGGLSEESNEERKAAKKGFFPSSLGLSFLVPEAARSLAVAVCWGDYEPREVDGSEGKSTRVWQRLPRELTVPVPLEDAGEPVVHDVPESGGLQLHTVVRPLATHGLAEHLPSGTRSVSVFLVNHRSPIASEAGEPDLAYAFQPELEIRCELPFVARPNLRGARASEWDEQVADLHYAHAPAYATGHGVSAEWETVDGACHLLRTTWISTAEVEAEALAPFSDTEVLEAIRRAKRGGAEERPVEQIELEALLAAPEGFGDDVPVDPNFHARRLPDHTWRRSELSEPVESVIQLHRLREVLAPIGFTRFEAVMPDINGEYETDVERAGYCAGSISGTRTPRKRASVALEGELQGRRRLCAPAPVRRQPLRGVPRHAHPSRAPRSRGPHPRAARSPARLVPARCGVVARLLIPAAYGSPTSRKASPCATRSSRLTVSQRLASSAAFCTVSCGSIRSSSSTSTLASSSRPASARW
jgi:hypothetical protein